MQTVCNTYRDAGKGNLTAQNTRKHFGGRVCATDPAGGAYGAPTNPLAGGKGCLRPPEETHPRSRPFGPRLSYPHSKISSDALGYITSYVSGYSITPLKPEVSCAKQNARFIHRPTITARVVLLLMDVMLCGRSTNIAFLLQLCITWASYDAVYVKVKTKGAYT